MSKQNFLIIGDDAYVKEREIDRIKKEYLAKKEAGVNYSVHQAEDINVMIDTLGTMPFLSEKRVALVKDIQDLDEEGLIRLVAYLKNPCGTSVLIMTSDMDIKRSQYFSDIVSYSEMVSAEKPSPDKVKKWIRTFFDREKISVSDEVIDLLIRLKGDDMGAIKTELEKIASYSAGKAVSAQEVEDLVGRSVSENIFKLTDAIESRQPEKVYLVLNDLYDQKNKPSELIGYLAKYFYRLQTVRFMSARGERLEIIAKAADSCSTGYVKRLQGKAGIYPGRSVADCITLLYEADRDIKTGKREPVLAMEMLVFSLMKKV